jgi:hypothetical protein
MLDIDSLEIPIKSNCLSYNEHRIESSRSKSQIRGFYSNFEWPIFHSLDLQHDKFAFALKFRLNQISRLPFKIH